MKLSTRVRYGLRAMIDLALHQKEQPVLARDIAKRTGISVKYLEQILLILRKGGLVRSVRGIRGGFLLSKRPEEISAYQVVTLFEGSISPVDCLDAENFCQRAKVCAARCLWEKIRDQVNRLLSGTTLADLAEQQASFEKTASYVI
ncbi:MAG TPA: Rrf2 family transcriptional regulator [bacterium]|nr:Rrf2 family transcriptional regulator [bacterium]HPP11143.1 Rrf2 family transcriptional regulator [bacterium]